MRYLILSVFVAMPVPALAHVGHLGWTAGHDHWIAGIAIGIALGGAVWGALKGREEDKADADDGSDAEAEVETA